MDAYMWTLLAVVAGGVLALAANAVSSARDQRRRELSFKLSLEAPLPAFLRPQACIILVGPSQFPHHYPTPDRH